MFGYVAVYSEKGLSLVYIEPEVFEHAVRTLDIAILIFTQDVIALAEVLFAAVGLLYIIIPVHPLS